MNIVDQAAQTQLENIQKRSGKSLEELFELLRQSGLAKHGELRNWLKNELSMGHGDANMVVHFFLQPKTDTEAPTAATEDLLSGIYTGKKAHLRPIHEKLMSEIASFGDFEVAPKKSYISLRRKKQFAMVGPATQTRVEVGLNMKGLSPTDRLLAMPEGGMCSFKVNLTTVDDVDQELIGWIKQAFDAAG
ncbi:MAG: DUF4287 domain-containing protein [Zavarzinella sp.]